MQHKEEDRIILQRHLEMLEKWNSANEIIWKFLTAYKKKQRSVKISYRQSKIYLRIDKVGHEFEIFINIVNESYLELHIKIVGNSVFDASISGIEMFDEEGIVKIVAEIVTHSEKIK